MLITQICISRVRGSDSLLCFSLPELEKQGGNLTVECILRGIDVAIKLNNIKYITNLYIQLVNVNSNKCLLAELAKNGIIRNVKVSYLIAGHTHRYVVSIYLSDNL